MSNKKRAGARTPSTPPRISRPVGAPRAPAPSPLVIPALVIGTVVVLALIAVFALSKSANSTATPATPLVTPGTAVPTPIDGPLPGIGMLDSTSGSATVGKPPAIGSRAPDFGWRTTAGHTTLSAMRGHAVLLEFFGAWCPACQQEVPLLNSLHASYGPQGLDVLSVTGSPYGIDYETTGNTAQVTMTDLLRYQRAFSVTFPEVLDPNTRVFYLYGRGTSYPTFYVIDRKGIVRFSSSVIPAKDLTARIVAALH